MARTGRAVFGEYTTYPYAQVNNVTDRCKFSNPCRAKWTKTSGKS